MKRKIRPKIKGISPVSIRHFLSHKNRKECKAGGEMHKETSMKILAVMGPGRIKFLSPLSIKTDQVTPLKKKKKKSICFSNTQGLSVCFLLSKKHKVRSKDHIIPCVLIEAK